MKNWHFFNSHGSVAIAFIQTAFNRKKGYEVLVQAESIVDNLQSLKIDWFNVCSDAKGMTTDVQLGHGLCARLALKIDKVKFNSLVLKLLWIIQNDMVENDILNYPPLHIPDE